MLMACLINMEVDGVLLIKIFFVVFITICFFFGQTFSYIFEGMYCRHYCLICDYNGIRYSCWFISYTENIPVKFIS